MCSSINVTEYIFLLVYIIVSAVTFVSQLGRLWKARNSELAQKNTVDPEFALVTNSILIGIFLCGWLCQIFKSDEFLKSY